MEIAYGVGTLLLIYEATKKRAFGHYAQILVDIDLSKHIFEEVMVEREGYAFYVPVVYERLPEFCSICYTIGHFVALCNKLHSKPKDDKPKSAKHKEKRDFSRQPITIHHDQPLHDPPKDTEMPSSNALKDVIAHNTNKQSEEVPVANDDDEQDTNTVTRNACAVAKFCSCY